MSINVNICDIKSKNYTLNDYNILLSTIHKNNEIIYEKINEKIQLTF